jgi:N-acetylglucosaminyldiphosphoundecaprenol N-acetyl-beta-D-mannosaminyltransferase
MRSVKVNKTGSIRDINLQALKLRGSAVILGVPIDNLTMDETIDLLDAFVLEGRASGKVHQVATANVDFLVKAQGDKDLLSILQRAELVTADGMPLVWGARLLGVPFKERVAGSDFVPLIARRSAQKGYSIFLLGAAPQVAKRAAEILVEKNPGLRIAGVISPPLSPIDKMDPAIIDQINLARPDFLLVAFGNPKQEKWIARNREKLQVPVMVGIGGTLDFITGTTRRAPRWTHKLGLEWIFRLANEPRRLFKRYLVDLFIFNAAFLRQFGATRFAQPLGSALPASFQVENGCVRAEGDLTVGSLSQLLTSLQTARAQSTEITLDLEKIRFIDNRCAAALLDLAHQMRTGGATLCFKAIPDKILRLMRILQITDSLLVS